MRVPVRFTALVGWAAAVTACGLDAGGLADGVATVDGGGSASRFDAGGGRGDAATRGPGDDDAAIDAPAASTFDSGGVTVVVVPAGWALVAVAATQSQPCPGGFAASPPADVFERPNASSACSCGPCTVTSPPSCATGPVDVFYDVGAFGGSGCGLAGMPAQDANSPAGGCNTDLFKGDISGFDIRLVPPAPTGGVCTSPGAASLQNVSYGAAARACVPDNPASAGCSGSVCSPSLPPPYRACIASTTAVAMCPAGFPERHAVGTGVTVDCSSCGCATSATCSGTMTVYTDTMCQEDPLAMPVDAVCRPTSAPPGVSYGSYRYSGQASDVACQAAGTSTATNVELTGQETICCP